jgi:group I intron endonuclease
VFIVYRLENTANGKCYIGISARSLATRWNEHLVRTREGKRNSRLYQAIAKYGYKSFKREILATAESEDDVRRLETKFIKKFDSYNNGYNCNLGGRGFLIFPMHIRKKIGAAQKGKFIPPETRAKMSLAKLGDKRCAKQLGDHIKKGGRNPRAGRYLIKFPDGSERIIVGLRAFCRKRKLLHSKLSANGHTKGFVLLKRFND